jgi:predicted SnoaL-like aldol condensation-catalyzing enzyme
MTPPKFYWAIVLLIASPIFGQGYLSGIALNKKIVSDFYRVVFEPRNADLIGQYIAADFIEHNPKMVGGREGLAAFLKTLPPPANDDVGSEMKDPPALVVAEADLVTFVFKRKTSNSGDKTKVYDRFTFDAFRVKNGKIVEHWDGDTK